MRTRVSWPASATCALSPTTTVREAQLAPGSMTVVKGPSSMCSPSIVTASR